MSHSETPVESPIRDRFITLHRGHPDFRKYLAGKLKTVRAIPIRTLNPGAKSESVTFELVPISDIARPHWAKLLWKAFRFQYLIFSLGPALVAFALLERGPSTSFKDVIIILMTLASAHLSLNALNDVRDHFGGIDRADPLRGSRSLQKGWVTAEFLAVGSGIFAAAAITFGLIYIFSLEISNLAFRAAATGVAGAFMGMWLARGGSQIVRSLIAFILMGPWIFLALALAMGVELRLGPLFISVYFGLKGFLFLNTSTWIANFADQSKPRPFLHGHDFDRAKKRVLYFHLAALLALIVGAYFYQLWAIGLTIIPFYFFVRILSIVRRTNSPLSSKWLFLRHWIAIEMTLVTLAIVMAILWASPARLFLGGR